MNTTQETLSAENNDRLQMLEEIRKLGWELVNQMENEWKPANERKNKVDLAHQLLQVMTKFLLAHSSTEDLEAVSSHLRQIIQSKIAIKYKGHNYGGLALKIAGESYDYMALFDMLKNLALSELLRQAKSDNMEERRLAAMGDGLRSKLHTVVHLRPSLAPVVCAFL